MRFPPSLVVGAVCLSTGAALFVSRGVLDRVLTAEGSVRLALLPPWQSLAGFTLATTLAVLFLTHSRSASPRTTTGVRVPTAALVTPLFGLLALLLPYLPWLPDRLPALQMLAGPARYLVWMVVLSQLAWVAWQIVPRPARVLERLPLRAAAVAVGVATLLLTGLAAARLTRTDLVPGGDEPHYLIIAQSLWNDGDFKIENNHTQGDYLPYFRRGLGPHYLTRGVDGEIYSVHPVGLPVLLAPIYALGGYPLVVVFLLVLAAAATALMWLWVTQQTNHAGAATFACAAIVVSPPFALNSFAVYPEIVAAIAVVVGLIVMPRADHDARDLRRWLLAGAMAGALPWLSTKYAPMSAGLIVVGLSRIWLTGSREQIVAHAAARVRRSVALLVPYLVMLAAWFTFFYLIWGTPRPQAPYGGLVQTQLSNLIFGGPGLLFDQEYGLLVFAPVYVLAATGLFIMWRTGGEFRRRAIEIAILWVGLLGTVGAFRIWWGGSASPARPVVSGLLLLALPMAVAFRAAGQGTAQRAAQHLLLWVGAWLTLLLLVPENGLLINNLRDGTSSVLEYTSPLWEAWTLAPTFIYHEVPTALAHTLVWLVIAGIAAWLLRRVRVASAGAASLVAIATFFGALVAVAIVMPQMPADPAWPRVDLASRAWLAGLNQFDRTSLPNAVVYDALHVMDAEHAESRLVLKVVAGARRGPPPVRVLHNGRFSMPAGRYRVDLRFAAESPLPAAQSERIALQIGRLGAPLQTWSLTPSSGGHWQTEIDLPLDSAFVGFVGSHALERSVAEIALTPLSLVDRARRVQTPQVLAAARYGPTTVLFHDSLAYPERTGFWTMGEQRMQLAMANDEGHDGSIRLTLRSGPQQANRVEISTAGWREVLDLQPETTASVTLPRPARRVIELEIQTDKRFVPARVDAASQDRRNLGAWVEIEALPAPEIARRP